MSTVVNRHIYAENFVPRPLSLRQGHSLTHEGWENPVRWQDIYGNFSQLLPDIPVLWGTVEDSVDRMNEIGIKPLGVTPHPPSHNCAHIPVRPLVTPWRGGRGL